MTVSYNYSKIWKISYPILLTLFVQNVIQVTSTAFLGHVGEIELERHIPKRLLSML